MKFPCAWFRRLALILGCLTSNVSGVQAAEPIILTRLFFQDEDACTLKWADLQAGSPPTLGPVHDVAGFPKLDHEKQTLVQMGAAHGMLLVGVRDDEDGKRQSGWVLIDSGVRDEDHNGHSHSTYNQTPKVRASVLDDKQGNPAHLYVYDDIFYLANDKLAGYTRIDPALLKPADTAAAIIKKAEFIPGGGGHITLAALDKQIGYSTWTDRAGDNVGRVDVTPFATRKIAYSLKLPTGGLHGATVNSGNVFFAPVDGICWVPGDATGTQPADPVQIQHLSLGKDKNDKPVRTGAFTNFGKHVLFVTGSGEEAALQLLDAQQATPTPHKLSLKLPENVRPVGPIAGTMVGQFPVALVFHDPQEQSEETQHVSVIELDPNLDGNFQDARVAKTLEVGKSRVEGHAGHHDAAFISDRRHVVITNPGDGTLQLLRARRSEIVAEFKVGGAPAKIEAIGVSSGD